MRRAIMPIFPLAFYGSIFGMKKHILEFVSEIL